MKVPKPIFWESKKNIISLSSAELALSPDRFLSTVDSHYLEVQGML